MPLQISFNDGTKRIDYAYDAAGIKCGEKVKDGDEEKQRTYIAGYEFVDGKLSSSSFEEGRIYYLDADEFEIAFYLQDHLGNNRIIFKENPAQITEPLVLQENHYYPFGMTMGSEMNYYDNQDPEDWHKYNSKELVEDCGLDFYDYGARWYDAAIGRFTSVDPLASDYAFQSPYAYATNNPVLLRDILGMGVEWEWRINSETGEKEKIGNDGGETTQYIYWNDDKEYSDILHGSDIFVGPVAKDWYHDGDIEFAVSTVDLWADIPFEYQGAYTKFDLADRYNQMKKGDPHDIAGQEAAGLARREMIWGIEDYGRYLENKYGSRSALVMAHDVGLLSYMMPSGVLVKGMTASQAAAKFPRNARFSTGFSPVFPPANPLPVNSWNRFLHMNKGKYAGKNWIQQAVRDYRALQN